MKRPVDLRVYELRARRTTVAGSKRKVHWQVNWRVDGRDHSKTLPSKPEAEDYRSRLIVAARDGVPFDSDAGVPTAWVTSSETFFAHAQSWIMAQRRTWSIRTHRSAVEAATRAVMLTLRPKAPAAPEHVRGQVARALAGEQVQPEALRWIKRWSLPLSRLDAKRARELHDQLGVGLRGKELAPLTAGRLRTTVHAMIVAAVKDRKLAEDPWPDRSRSRRRSSAPIMAPIDADLLPSKAEVLQVIEAMPKRTLKDRRAALGATIALYAGLRPSEILVLRPEDILLPEPEDAAAFGTITVARAEDGAGGVGPTKTNQIRKVPAHSELVAAVRAHLHEWDGELRDAGAATPLTIAGWRYRIHAGCRTAGVREFTTYDLRHVCATRMLQTGMSDGEAAKRLGHSVPVLTAFYNGVMRGDRERGNELMAQLF
jgi:integrase